jgi:hypothetical protein
VLECEPGAKRLDTPRDSMLHAAAAEVAINAAEHR